MVKKTLEIFESVVLVQGDGRILCSSNKHLSFFCYLLCSLIIPLHSELPLCWQLSLKTSTCSLASDKDYKQGRFQLLTFRVDFSPIYIDKIWRAILSRVSVQRKTCRYLCLYHLVCQQPGKQNSFQVLTWLMAIWWHRKRGNKQQLKQSKTQ